MGQKKSKHSLERASDQAGGTDHIRGRHKLDAKGILSISKSKNVSSVYANDILFGPLDLFNYTIGQPVEVLKENTQELTYEDILSGILQMAFPEDHPFRSTTDDGDIFYGHEPADQRKSVHDIAQEVISQSEALQWIISNFNVDLSEQATESETVEMFLRETQKLSDFVKDSSQPFLYGLDFARSLATRQQFVSFRKNVPEHIQLPDIHDYELGILYEMNKVLQTQIRYKGEHRSRLTVYSDDISRSTSVVCEPDLVYINQMAKVAAPQTQCPDYTSGVTVKVYNPRKHTLSSPRAMHFSNKSAVSVSSSHDTGIDMNTDYHGSVNIPSKYCNLPEKLIAALCDAIETAETNSNSILHEPEQNYLALVHDLQQHVLELLSAAQESVEEYKAGSSYGNLVYTMGLFVHNDDIYLTRLVSNQARLLLCTAKDAEQFWKQQMRIPLKHLTGDNKTFPLVTFSKQPLNLRIPSHRMGLMIFLKYYNSMVDLSLVNKQ